MKVLVCGGRRFAFVPTPEERHHWPEATLEIFNKQYRFLHDWLNQYHKEHQVTELIHGAARGADEAAGVWAWITNGILARPFPADWDTHGKSAGFIRNQQMLFEGHPDVVIAFPGGSGTKDMCRKASRAGVEVIEVIYDKG